MAILTSQEAKKIIDNVLSLSRADEVSVGILGGRLGNIRYARNSISTSGESNDMSLSVTTVFGKRSGTSSINEFDRSSLEKTVRRAEEMARLAPESPEYVPMLGPQQYLKTNTYSEHTANITPVFRANAAFYSIDTAKKRI